MAFKELSPQGAEISDWISNRTQFFRISPEEGQTGCQLADSVVESLRQRSRESETMLVWVTLV